MARLGRDGTSKMSRKNSLVSHSVVDGKAYRKRVSRSFLYYLAPRNCVDVGKLVGSNETTTSDKKSLFMVKSIQQLGTECLICVELQENKPFSIRCNRTNEVLQFERYESGPASARMLELAKYQITQQQFERLSNAKKET